MKVFQEHNAKCVPPDDDSDQCRLVNSWWSRGSQTDVTIWREPDNSLQFAQLPAANHFRHDFGTMACSIAWSIAAECQAIEKLKGLIPDHLWRGYFLTGMFVETSKRSQVSYIFRRLRPTVALRPGRHNSMHILCCLCMHSIGYYANTWAGALCPTDDVITHLLLMRSDEKMFWRRANQIPPYRPEAGL